MTAPLTQMQAKHYHYYRIVKGLDYIDVYRIIELFEVTNPCDQHALKKILCSGVRGHKNIVKDTQDVIDTMERKLEMLKENEKL